MQRIRRNLQLHQLCRDADGDKTFEEIKKEAQLAPPRADDARDVGCADIAASLLADVEPVALSDDEPERNGADQVCGQHRGDECNAVNHVSS